MVQRRIAIVSVAGDLHALIIQNALAKYPDVECCIIESNLICGNSIFTWSTADDVAAQVPVKGGEAVDVRDLDVVWWRRVGYPQELPAFVSDPAHSQLINNDCRAALLGVLLNRFQGTWVNHPLRNLAADNKIIQLQAAASTGFRVPQTLVSQNPEAVRRFCEQLEYNVIVKPLTAIRTKPLFTAKVTSDLLDCEDSVTLCPAMYQEFIPGTRHFRAQCFGDRVHAALLESDSLDWRVNRDFSVSPAEISEDLQMRLIKVLKVLGLKMGVVDLKLTPNGEPVWLEINPQGQFLFVEGLGGQDLTSPFCDFLLSQAMH